MKMNKKRILKYICYLFAFLLFLVSCALWIAIPNSLILNAISTFLMMLFIAGAIILDVEQWKKFYRSRWFYKFAGFFFTAILIFLILGLVNYLAYKHPLQWDVSQSAKNSLTAQSNQIVKALDKDLEVIIFARKDEFPPIMKLLDLYRYQKNNISYQTIDVELNPAEVSNYGITKSPTLVVKYDGKREYVSTLNELNFTNALIKVSRDRAPVVCYSMGHGEGNLDAKEGEGFSYLQRQILASNLTLKTVNLLSEGSIGKECSLYMIWGPQNEFAATELKALEDFLSSGGHLMVALDPNLNLDPTPKLRELISHYGVSLINGLAIDLISNVNQSNGQAPIVKSFSENHQITKDFSQQVFFPLVGAVAESKNSTATGTFEALASSNLAPAAWLDLGPFKLADGKLAITYDAATDISGPIAYMGIWKEQKDFDPAIVIAFANSTFVSNSYERYPANLNLFLNSLLWGVDEGRLISFDLPSLPDEPVMISGPQKGIIFYFSVIFLPIAFLALALVVYWRSKKQ